MLKLHKVSRCEEITERAAEIPDVIKMVSLHSVVYTYFCNTPKIMVRRMENCCFVMLCFWFGQQGIAVE